MSHSQDIEDSDDDNNFEIDDNEVSNHCFKKLSVYNDHCLPS